MDKKKARFVKAHQMSALAAARLYRVALINFKDKNQYSNMQLFYYYLLNGYILMYNHITTRYNRAVAEEQSVRILNLFIY